MKQTNSKDTRDDFVGHQLSVLLPVAAVLFGALLLIPERPVDEQRREEGEVEVGQRTGGEGGQAEAERRQQLEEVVEVAAHWPEAGGEQEGVPLGARLVAVLGANQPRPAAPDAAGAVGGADELSLEVDPVVGHHRAEAEEEDGQVEGDVEKAAVTTTRTVLHQVQTGQGVEAGHEGDAAPGDVVAEAVHRGVDCLREKLKVSKW